MKYLNTTSNSIELIDGDVILNLPFNALYTHIVDDNVSFLINYPSDVWDYDSLKQYRRVRPQFKYGDALMSANADQLEVNGSIYDIEQLKTILPNLINKSGGGGGGDSYIEEVYKSAGYSYALEEGNYIDILRNESYAITSGITAYDTFNKMSGLKMLFVPDLPITTTDCRALFKDCTNIRYIPFLDTSNVIEFGRSQSTGMFHYCTNLQTIPQLNTSKATITAEMFRGCTYLQNIPLLDTSNVIDMSSMFRGCKNLQTIPQLNTSKVSYMAYILGECTNLQNIPLIDTSNVIDISSMFNNCTNLQSIPQLDTSNATNMNSMFAYCKSLKTIPLLNTSKVSGIQYMFDNCTALESLPLLDFSSVTINMTYSNSFFRGNSSSTATTNIYPNLTDLKGFTGLKKNFWLNACQSLTEQSIINVFNEMADLNSTTSQTVHLGSINIAKCSPETLEIAIDKNWTIV